MFNQDLLKKLLHDFGEAETMLYCKLESAKNAYLFDECVKEGKDLTCQDYDFERDWWKDAEKKIKDNIKS